MSFRHHPPATRKSDTKYAPGTPNHIIILCCDVVHLASSQGRSRQRRRQHQQRQQGQQGFDPYWQAPRRGGYNRRRGGYGPMPNQAPRDAPQDSYRQPFHNGYDQGEGPYRRQRQSSYDGYRQNQGYHENQGYRDQHRGYHPRFIPQQQRRQPPRPAVQLHGRHNVNRDRRQYSHVHHQHSTTTMSDRRNKKPSPKVHHTETRSDGSPLRCDLCGVSFNSKIMENSHLQVPPAYGHDLLPSHTRDTLLLPRRASPTG